MALLIANIVGLVLLRDSLTDKIDEQLIGLGQSYARGSRHADAPPRNGGRRFAKRLGTNRIVVAFGPDGQRRAAENGASGVSPPALEPFDALAGRANRGEPYTAPATHGDTRWRVVAVRVPSTGGVVVLGTPLDEVDQTADQLLSIDIGVTLVILLGLGLVSRTVVKLGLRPLTRMVEVAEAITHGDLDRRVDHLHPRTEAGQLGDALNSMLARIQSEITARRASEERLRRFVADASHELRTPLTSIRGFAELYRRGGAPPGPTLDDTMARIEQEATRLAVLADEMLLLARLDQRLEPLRGPVDLLQIAADTVRDAHVRAPRRSIRLTALRDDDATLEPVTVSGDESGLRQVAANLVANALHHAPAPATVTVRVGQVQRAAIGAPQARIPANDRRVDGPWAVLEVSDTGPGVPEGQAARVFERFYRADASRGRGSGGGTGLGLAIVAAIVTAHGGRVELRGPADGGASFRVLVPTQPGSPPDPRVTAGRA
ncbi:HAMP domain-containing sensor histidine kinase [Pilimelia columellifera]|uniref:histidine kinase n=1 Tax=Pilimelia columellifera subsp. columellifera TaxID=706583 RepID=A0ABN3MYS4_9ACTN